MRLCGATIQTASAVTWGLSVMAASLLHRVPAEGVWGQIFWGFLGVLVFGSTLTVIGLTTVKLVGDSLFPDWIDRWWDRPPES